MQRLQICAETINSSTPIFSNIGECDRSIMDSPLIAQVFRHLLSHQTCSRLRFHPPLSRRIPPNAPGRRYYRSSNEDEVEDRSTSNWQQRTDIFPPDKLREYERYPTVTSDILRSRRERPKRVKMLARDFIEGTFPIESIHFC